MTTRDELLDHVAREKYRSAYTIYADRRFDHPIATSIRESAAEFVDPILARYAVVELPEPNGGPMGIEWKSHGDLVSGRVLAIGDDGEPFEILSVTYTVEQAAQMAAQLIDAIGGKQ